LSLPFFDHFSYALSLTSQAMEALHGVIEVDSGYSGGTVANPSYHQVVNGGTGHLEVVRVKFNPDDISYETLLYHFWRNVDPTDAYGQFCDKGNSYVSSIFCQPSLRQCELAKASKAKLIERFTSVATSVRELTDATPFYLAEEYHQDYYLKNPSTYKYYKSRCGRVATLKEVWGKEEYRIAHENGTKIADTAASDPWLWLKITLASVGSFFLCAFLVYLAKREQPKAKDKRVDQNQRENDVVASNVELA
jgi:peptide-methionine (S)-S-oxide reductase